MAADLPERFPDIDTMAKAVALGPILGQVLHYDAGWAERVYQGTNNTYGSSGPDALNKELQSQWSHYWTPDEKRRIFVLYIAARLDR